MVIAPAYDTAAEFHEGMARVYDDGKCGFVDKKGRLVVPTVYDDARHFSEGLAAVKVNDKWGFIDCTGTLVIQPMFSRVCDFDNGRAYVLGYRPQRNFYIDRSGKEVK